MNQQFSYRSSSDDKVFISWRRRVVTTLRGGRARQFLASTHALDGDGCQHLMARATGNFKRGNER